MAKESHSGLGKTSPYRIHVLASANLWSKAQSLRRARIHERKCTLLCARAPGTFQAGVGASWRPVVPARDAARLAAQLGKHQVEVVCGPLVEGAFVALLVSLELGCDFVYAERFADTRRKGLFPVEYRLPKTLQPAVKSKRVAIVNDVINAGSAVRGTFYDLEAIGVDVVAIGALLALGDAIGEFAAEHNVGLELLERMPNNLWTPSECPLCAAGMPLETAGRS